MCQSRLERFWFGVISDVGDVHIRVGRSVQPGGERSAGARLGFVLAGLFSGPGRQIDLLSAPTTGPRLVCTVVLPQFSQPGQVGGSSGGESR